MVKVRLYHKIQHQITWPKNKGSLVGKLLRCKCMKGSITFWQQSKLTSLNMNRNTLLRHIIALLFLLFVTFDAQFLAAQSLFQGTVGDAETGELLPAANLQIEGTFQGTITNAEGAFSLQISTLPAVLVIRYIGYETRRVEVTRDSEDYLDIRLQPIVYDLGEVVVTDEDAAISIMRKVIERKQQWREALDAYEAEAYTRFTLENDTGIVSIIESVTDVFWQQEEGMREVVKAQRKTSNLEFDEFMPAAQFMANLYDDDIDIAGYNFIGVTHPDALRHYLFELVGYRYLDETLVYDISVQPRNKFKTGFAGQIAVMDEEYALLEVQLEPGGAFLFPPPVDGFDIVFDQQFSNFGGGFWLPVDFRSEMNLDIGLGRLLSFPTIHIEQVSRMADYEINVALPDSLFEVDLSMQVDSVAVADTLAIEKSGLALPLEKAEVAAYETIDSTMTLEKAYEPEGVLSGFINTDSDDDGVTVQGGSSRGINLGLDVDGAVRFNRVEGLYSELGLGKSFNRRVELRSAVGFSTAQSGESRWSYDIGAGLFIGSQRQLDWDVSFARYTDTQTPSTSFLQLLNGTVTLFGGRDYYDYYRNERFRTSLTWRNRKIDMRLTVGLNLEEHSSLEKATDYDLLGDSFVRRDNPGVSEGRLRSVSARLHWGDDENTAGFLGKKSLSVFMEFSTPSFLDSEFDFTTYGATIDWRFNTFFQRRLIPNTLDIRVDAQTSTERTPFQRLGAINGSMELFNTFGVLKTRELGPYRGGEHLAVFWEHNFRTFPFELLGMSRLAENALNIIVFGGHGSTETKVLLPGLDTDLYATNGWHHEVGVSLSGLFSVLRLDFARRLDAHGYYVGISTARIF